MQLWWLVVVVLDSDNVTGHINSQAQLDWWSLKGLSFHSVWPSFHGQVQRVLAIAEEEMASSA